MPIGFRFIPADPVAPAKIKGGEEKKREQGKGGTNKTRRQPVSAKTQPNESDNTRRPKDGLHRQVRLADALPRELALVFEPTQAIAILTPLAYTLNDDALGL